MKQTKTDWTFITVFYIGGMSAMAFGLSGIEKYAGAGLFITLFGLCSVFAAIYNLPAFNDYKDGE